ncbi:MAG TPA: sugar phosphate nucleotidyltransferase [Gemmatimonadales bacterium]|nr:sugar phosphate nucleotidyltransferase [Gemmatimonadales bacterium]
MKVVLFCGGLGLRIQGGTESVPKPMVCVGTRPILWHVMKYYAHFGHDEFVLCLGYRGDAIKDYFLNYPYRTAFDGKEERPHTVGSDVPDWKITFVDTGRTANVGQRLKAVEPHVRDEPEFMANYSDGLTDLPLPTHLAHFRERRAVGTFVSVRPHLSYHAVEVAGDGLVTDIREIGTTPLRINGGFFVFRPEIFDYIRAEEDLVNEPFRRLVKERKLAALEYDGFWQSMDTLKDRQQLEQILASGRAPWEVWAEVRPLAAEVGRPESLSRRP